MRHILHLERCIEAMHNTQHAIKKSGQAQLSQLCQKFTDKNCMPRLARSIIQHIPYHVTQRGNRKSDLFLDSRDREFYLDWLFTYSSRFELKIKAYCLMRNHIHLVATPTEAHSLSKTMLNLNTKYALTFNKKYELTGHLFEGRFFSAALDEGYLWNALKYVEQNPVRANLVERAEDYVWSSAKYHCGIDSNSPYANELGDENDFVCSFAEWKIMLAENTPSKTEKEIRNNTLRGYPCGSSVFVEKLEALTGLKLRPARMGRPRKVVPVPT